jgi:predicted alpha/beta-hydrolase family hydrolase
VPAAGRGATLTAPSSEALRAAVREVETPTGTARITLSTPGSAGLFALGHGAGGGIEAPDLLAVSSAVHDAGWTVARIEQPYRVKGHRAPPRPPVLDEAWCAVLSALANHRGPRLVVSGRSSGARVAVRTAAGLGADGVVALAFPLHPPGRPDKPRADELKELAVPALIVQGHRDAFGTLAEFPKRMPGVSRVEVPGDHSLKQGVDAAAAAVTKWLAKTFG